MKRKLLTAVLVLSMFTSALTGLQTAAAEDEGKKYGNYIDIAVGLGLMGVDENGDFHPEDCFTRSEMAELIVDIVEFEQNYTGGAQKEYSKKYDPWEFYEGATNFAESSGGSAGSAAGDGSALYKDVPSNSASFEDIKKVSTYGIMNGYDGMFNPNDNLRTIEALATVVNLLGYSQYAKAVAEYPKGYQDTARRLDLSVSSSGEYITRAQVAKLITDALDTSMLEVVGAKGSDYVISKDQGTTLLNNFFKADKISGRVMQNEITSFTGRSALGKKQVQIENTVLRTNDRSEYVQELIGRNVDCYYFNGDSENDGEIIYCTRSNKNEEMTFPISNFEEYENNRISYSKDNKTYNKTVSVNPHYIYNGVAVTSCPDEYFDGDQGTITLVTDSSGKYDLIIIESYESWYVDKAYETGSDMYEIVNKLKDKQYMTIDPQDTQNVRVYTADGNKSEVTSIVKNSVIDVLKNGDYVKIIVSSKRLYDTQIDVVGQEEDITYIKSGNVRYDLAKSYTEGSEYYMPTTGMKYDLYFNSFGNVAYIKNIGSDDFRMGYLTKFVTDDNEEEVYAKIITKTKTQTTFTLDEKINFSGTDGKLENKKIKSYQEYNTYLKGVGAELIRYKLNEDSKITAIERALEKDVPSESEDRLRVLLVTSKDESDPDYYYHAEGNLGCRAYMGAGTPVLVVPTNPGEVNDINKYQIVTYKELAKGGVTTKVYNLNENSPLAEYVVYYDNAGVSFSEESKLLSVTDLTEVVDEDGEIAYEITGYHFDLGTIKLYYGSDDDLATKGILPYPLAVNQINQSNILDSDYCHIAKGDIILANYDASNRVASAALLYDADGRYDNSQYTDRIKAEIGGYVTSEEEVTALIDKMESFTYAEPGILAGTIGYYDKHIKNTNPYMNDLKGVGAARSSTANRWNMGAQRFLLGYVYKINGDYVTITTKNILKDGVPEDGTDFVTEVRERARPWTYMNFEGKDIHTGLIKDDLSQLRSYEDYGSECSQILFYSTSTAGRQGVIINR